jgi:SHS2 domain-containing protein
VAEFELLDHPADIGFRAQAQSLEELFATCARALLSIILDASHAQPTERWDLSAQGGDLESLLVNWLNEVLYFVDTKRVVFSDFELKLNRPESVRCTCYGEKRDPQRHPVRVLVKAVTYHQLRISESNGRWTAEVFVDV